MGESHNNENGVDDYDFYYCECRISIFDSSATNLVLKDRADLQLEPFDVYAYRYPHHFEWYEGVYKQDGVRVWADSINLLLVTAVKANAFKGRTKLQHVRLPDTCRTIGTNAFNGCTALTSIELQEGLESIGDYAFANCTSLTNIVIPNSVTNIGENVFRECTNLRSITLGNGLKEIPDLEDCTNLVSVKLGNGITEIPDNAFYEATHLKSLTLGNNVTHIGDYAFYGCSALTNIVIPDSVKSIGNSAFGGCSALTSLVIPDSVTIIGYSAFYGCTGLLSVEIGNGVTGWPFGGFSGCTNLVAVTLGNGITSISGDYFGGFGKLERVLVRSGNPAYASLDGVVFTTDRSTLVLCPPGKRGVYTVPTGVETIERSAFQNSALETVYLPAGLAEIRDLTFQGASNLLSVQLPAGVERIGFSAFAGCTSLESVTLSASLERIGDSAFADCTSLKSVMLPASVANIADSAFNGCTRLSSYVVASGNAVYSSADGVLFDAEGATLLAYPAGRPGAVYTIPAGVEAIRPTAFKDCPALEALEVAAGNGRYSSIGGALYNRDGTELLVWPRGKDAGNVVIPPGTLQIGDSVFEAREDLVSVALPERLQRIGRRAFRGCSGLTAVELPKGLKRIESSAFAGTGLKTVTVPKSVRWIGGSAFQGTPLQSATVLGGAISGSDGAFYGCPSLKTLTLGTRVSAISYYAFANLSLKWSALETVHAPVSWEGKTCPLSGGFFGTHFTIVYDNEVDDGEPTEEEEEYEDVWDYQVVDGGAVLGTWSEVGGKVVIPSTLGGYPVTAIANFAFSDGGNVFASLRIPDSVASIGLMAFANCNALMTLYVPASWEGTDMLAKAGVPEGCTVVYGGGPEEKTTSTGVPYAWLEENAAAILAANGGDHEAAVKAPAANGRPVWECYVADVSATDAAEDFKTVLVQEDGQWVAKPSPDRGTTRTYTVQGAVELGDESAWGPVTDDSRFFRVKVTLPE